MRVKSKTRNINKIGINKRKYIRYVRKNIRLSAKDNTERMSRFLHWGKHVRLGKKFLRI